MTAQILPPDPEGMNDLRSEWAGQAIAVFTLATGTLATQAQDRGRITPANGTPATQAQDQGRP